MPTRSSGVRRLRLELRYRDRGVEPCLTACPTHSSAARRSPQGLAGERAAGDLSLFAPRILLFPAAFCSLFSSFSSCPRRFSASDSLHFFCQSHPRSTTKETEERKKRTKEEKGTSPVSPFLSAGFCCPFSSFCASGPLHVFCQSLPFSHLSPPATRPARLISAFRSFLYTHQFCLSPYREHRLL
jgi:hypothetical protein